MIFKNGEIVIITLHDDESINKKSMKKFQIAYFEGHELLSRGNFVKLSHGPYQAVEDSLLFVNDQHAFLIQDDRAFMLYGLDPEYKDFQSAKAIHDRQYLAITYYEKGIIIYELKHSKSS